MIRVQLDTEPPERQTQGAHLILITSASSGDGKTTSAIALARALAEADHRVVLMDLDLRKPDLASVLHINGNAGVTSLLDEPAQLSIALVSGDVPLLQVLPAGPEASEHLLRPVVARMPEMMAQLREMADYVVIDTPPLGEVSDAYQLLPFVDDVIVVARPGNTRRASFQFMRDLLGTQLARPRARLTGAMRDRSLPRLRPRTVALLAAPLGLAIGVLMARHAVYGLTGTAALLYGPLIFLNLPIGLVLWAPLPFMDTLHFAWSGPAVVSVLLFAAWIGTLAAARRQRAAVLSRQRFLVTAIVALLVWLTLSLAWSRDLGAAGESLVDWFVAGAVFLVVATTITGERTLRLMLLAFVFGGVISVIIGVATTGLSSPIISLPEPSPASSSPSHSLPPRETRRCGWHSLCQSPCW